MKKIKLEENLYCFVTAVENIEKGKFTTYVLHTNTQVGSLDFKFWNLSKGGFPKVGDYLLVRVTDIEQATSELVTYKTLSLDSTSKSKPYFCEHSVVDEEIVPQEIRRLINRDRSEQVTFAAELLQDGSYWTDKKNYKFLIEFIKTNFEKFRTVPAALGHHHNYKGGLFVHSSEVFSNSFSIINSFCNKKFYQDRVDSDVVYLSSWLHDAGKMEVYYLENETPKMDFEKEDLIGHSTISNLMFVEAAKKFGLEDDFIYRVSHCILSHHRKKEWGAVVEPDTLEAHILCDADLISSKISN